MKKIIIILTVVVVLIIIAFNSISIHGGQIPAKDAFTIKTQSTGLEQSLFFKTISDTNKITCINLWASWCVPCVGEMPTLNLIKEKYKNDAIQFLSLSVDEDSTKLAAFNTSGKFNFTDITFADLTYRNSILNYLENEPLDHVISTNSVPKTYLIKNKKVIKKYNGGIESDELTNVIDKLLKEQKN